MSSLTDFASASESTNPMFAMMGTDKNFIESSLSGSKEVVKGHVYALNDYLCALRNLIQDQGAGVYTADDKVRI